MTLESNGGSAKQHRLLVYAVEYSDDVVRRLISKLESPSSTIESLQRASMELRHLAKDSIENRRRIAAAGAIGPLVALLSHADPQLQEHVVTAILNLSLCYENKVPIAAAGAVRHLVRTLSTGTPTTRDNSASALCQLSLHDDLSASIGLSGAIPPLVALLQSGSVRGKKDAASALFVLLFARDFTIRAVEAGVVLPLLNLMANSESDMVDKAAYVLQKVVKVAEGRTAAVEEDAIPVLVDMVETGTPRQREIAIGSLLEICRESAGFRKMVVDEGAIPPLIELSQTGTRKARNKAQSLIQLLRPPRTA